MKAKPMINEMKRDYTLRSFIYSSLSSLATLAFLGYNLFMGIAYHSIWNISISIYYFLLLTMKSTVIMCEKIWRNASAELLRTRRVKLFRAVCRILILVDAAMALPIALMVMSQRQVDMGMIPAIAVAAYTTYKVTLAVINYQKTRKKDHLSLHLLKIINLMDAMVAVLTLQNTLVTVFGEGEDMLMLTSWTSAGMLGLMVTLTVILLQRAKRIKNKE